MSDLELVSLNLTAEYLSIDSEMQLFRKLPNFLKTNIIKEYLQQKKTKSFLSYKSIILGINYSLSVL